MGMALELKLIIENNLISVSYCCIGYYFCFDISFKKATRRSTLVIKVGVEGMGVHVSRGLKKSRGVATSYKSCDHSWKSFIALKIINVYFHYISYIYIPYTLVLYSKTRIYYFKQKCIIYCIFLLLEIFKNI